jgi:two-component system capsular synthesis response regulator RcsB
MFNQVLIAEDQQSTNFWLQQTLKDLEIIGVKYAYYCDDALLRLKNGMRDGAPFDLLITDLSFVDDGREQKLSDGAKLIKAAKDQQPDLKVLVFSAEPSVAVVNGLFQQLSINGYVHKGRTDTLDLKAALECIYKGKIYIPAAFQQSIRHKNAFAFSKYDVAIIEQLAQGTHQKNIPEHLKQQGMKASSLSSIEKRLNQIKDSLGFTKNEQLIAYCKDRKII